MGVADVVGAAEVVGVLDAATMLAKASAVAGLGIQNEDIASYSSSSTSSLET